MPAVVGVIGLVTIAFAELYQVIVPVAQVPLRVALSPTQIGVVTATAVGVVGFGLTTKLTVPLASLAQPKAMHFAV